MSEPERRNWRDSNWYVSMTGFWREYKKHRIGILGIAVLSLFVFMAVGAPLIATHDPSPTNRLAPRFAAPQWMAIFDPTGVVSADYAPTPTLDDPNLINIIQNISTPGAEARFTGQHMVSPEGDGYVNLTWTHTANDTIDFRDTEDADVNIPDANDFVYFTQAIDWSQYNTLPKDVNVTISYGVKMTGDFLTNTYGGRMFEISVWLIDSSGNWRKIYVTDPPYLQVIQSFTIDISYLEMVSGWGGMIEVDGVQEDPTDILNLAVGLSPTDKFQYHFISNSTPYTYYNGSVSAIISGVSCTCFGDYFGILGSTNDGADAWSQLVYGTRISLIIGILATALSTAVGVIVGMVAGYFGGKTDEILMRVVDFLLVIPGLPLMMVLAAFLGPSIDTIIVVIAVLGWTGTSRLIRSQVLAEKNKAYVESARAIGASDTYIIFRHILPNVTPILFANITLGVVGAILSESGLSFLGLTDPSEPSWGRMLADAQGNGAFTSGAWWVVVFPGLMITTLSLSFTFIGHTLDQVLNPRLRER
ncbi:MAG: ABC transporter permease [Candidatus Thorarchaeota archaeon]|nr:ABC transporter permease [Candidatus Thorarchaeota archaeon]